MTTAVSPEPTATAMAERIPDPHLAAAVATTLDGIADPCLAAAGLPGSIIDLGLVQAIRASADGRVEIDLSLTEMGCAFTHHLLDAVWQTVQGVAGVTETNVTPVWTWDPSQMRTPLARDLAARAADLPDQLAPTGRHLPLLRT